MQKLIFISITILLIGCLIMTGLFKRKGRLSHEYNPITVTGHTQNIAGHAAVIDASSDIYYVDGMDAWEKDWLNHTVRITGDLAHEQINKDQQESERIIKAAVVMLLHSEPTLNY